MAKRPLSPVNSVLNKVLANLGLDRRLREHTFMTLWPTFVAGALAERSRPLFIDSSANLVISVADAATGQELSMLKGKLLSKVTATARSLNIDVRGLRLDLKHYHGVSTMPQIEQEPAPPKPTQEELNTLTLTPGDMTAIEDLCRQLNADANVDEALRRRMVGLYESELRIRRWRFLKGFPVCPGCGNPVERLHPPQVAHMLPCGDRPLCLTCLYSDNIGGFQGGTAGAVL
jgi:Dna[CI] antecedent, DciA